jgi:hypothetical protein
LNSRPLLFEEELFELKVGRFDLNVVIFEMKVGSMAGNVFMFGLHSCRFELPVGVFELKVGPFELKVCRFELKIGLLN